MIMIIFDFFYNNFEIRTNSMFKSKDNSFNKIKLILNYIEAKFVNKKAISVIEKLTIIFKRKKSKYNKRKKISKNRCFNY